MRGYVIVLAVYGVNDLPVFQIGESFENSVAGKMKLFAQLIDRW